jgi:hypothetical protein
MPGVISNADLGTFIFNARQIKDEFDAFVFYSGNLITCNLASRAARIRREVITKKPNYVNNDPSHTRFARLPVYTL